ncbi:unnamed protein product [Spirodela intermedia]|uniref:RNA-dependent RNA polymerase n=1 Tax=Spirodela intermedia TaxID=51605 RepID=A0A7I8IG67_SPIIN|nr:unnamed protein product [Spirodela intermedia]CAA6656073.1 unnamed protein product [Spirodela intermedia]
MAPARATVGVSGIPMTAVARELFDFFEGAVGSVFACEIFTVHENWKSRGAGRIQFETVDAAEEALRRHADGRLGVFQRARLLLSEVFDDIIVRPAEPRNRLCGAVLRAGFLSGEREMEVLETWEGVRVELMPERQKVELLLEQEGRLYKLEIMFGDISGSFICSVREERETAILLKLKYAPRIYHRISGPTLTPRFRVDRYHFCKEDFQFRWVRSVDFSASRSIGQSSYFCLDFPGESSRLEDAIRNFLSMNRLNHCSSEFPPIISYRLDPLSPLPYEIFFQLNYLVHTQKISHGQVNSRLFHRLSSLPVDKAGQILVKLRREKSTCFDPAKFIEDHSGKAQRDQRSHVSSSNTVMNCHRALVTPSRVYLVGPELEASNYVLKHYVAYASDFLRVSFVEEDWSKIPSDAISTRIESGAFSEPYRTSIYRRIFSKKFEFLAFSASQLRGHSAWMFASNHGVRAEEIRAWMGRFNKIRSVSKCAARMGQLFSSSIQTFNVPHQEAEIIQDVEASANGIDYCFSDGIGKISLSFARQVAQKCGLNHTPSAFQIRYGGYKGVVAIDRNSFRKLSLRRSMQKFDSTNTMLNVTRWSESTPCYLNREIICLLSTLGVRDEVFEDLQRKNMRDLDEMLDNREAAMKVLEGAAGGDARTAMKMLIHGYEPSAEPYLSMLLKARHESQLSEMRSKCRIFVPRGRVLIGCLDEARALNYGQFTSEKIDGTTAAVIGKVVVTKNPCLHPGDIRVLDAVYEWILEEKGLVDCIVFPQKGERPHPSECSGGDLDGDLYFVSWDKNLIPPTTDEPMDYIPRRPRIMDHEVTLEEIQRFFVDYMINDTLGAISTAHLVHADRARSKARSGACLQLARLHSASVDFAKSGAPAEMPKLLRPKEIAERRHPRAASSNPVNFDGDLQVKGFEAFLDAAKGHRDLYAEKLRDLMDYFGATCEDEILTGNLRNRSVYLRTDRRRYAEVKDRILDDRPKMASAWYHVTYHPNYGLDSSFLSFPWAICDILLSIKSRKCVHTDA